MKIPNKELYSMLGVDSDVSQEAIRSAYLARTRIIHPDRFDKKLQPKDWEQANIMLAELNEAYAILKNPKSRKKYDILRAEGKKKTPQSTPPMTTKKKGEPKNPFGFGIITPGYTKYSDLPESIRKRLVDRQNGKKIDFFRAKLDSLNWNYIFVVVLLCNFFLLFKDAKDSEWHPNTLGWYWFFTLVVGFLIARNAIKIFTWFKSALKPYFYVTPVYFVKTEYDIVRFWPIWSLKDFGVTHVHTNGVYTRSDVTLQFEDFIQVFSVKSKLEVEKLFELIKTFDLRIRTAFQGGKIEYLKHHDDFFGVGKPTVLTNSFLSKWEIFGIYLFSMATCALLLLIAIKVNGDYEQSRWVYHSPTSVVSSSNSQFPDLGSKISTPAEPLPSNGKVDYFTYEKSIAPLQIKADKGSNYLVKLVDVLKGKPALTVFVRDGQTVTIHVPLGSYEMRYALGSIWYGSEYLFGPDSAYYRADKRFDFVLDGDQAKGYTITLYKVQNGNLKTSPIQAVDF